MSPYAVITGDIVASSKLEGEERKALLRLLKAIFAEVKRQERGLVREFDIFRGDSFQGMVEDPRSALDIALYIRLKLLADEDEAHPHDWDARIAIGIGEVSYLGESVATSDGLAFRRSGPMLDEMKREERLKITSGKEEFDWEMQVAMALLDGLTSRWTSKQAQVMLEAMKGKRQTEIAETFGMSQPAVSKMLKIAHWEAVEALIERYHYLVEKLA